jgi:DNA repair exonuclease SbcCD ATPase subunit
MAKDSKKAKELRAKLEALQAEVEAAEEEQEEGEILEDDSKAEIAKLKEQVGALQAEIAKAKPEGGKPGGKVSEDTEHAKLEEYRDLKAEVAELKKKLEERSFF